MKGFERDNLLFSLCGLNCGLCPMRVDRYCPGCGGGAGNQSCAIARCSMAKGNLAYCDLCPAFPCQKYRDLDVYDSFITHRNRWKDFARAREIGMDAYCAEQMQKVNCLQTLLANYNDGRKKRYFCLAVNLLPWQEVCAIVDELQARPGLHDLPSKERAAQAVQVFELAAQRYGVELKLRRKKTSKQNGD